MARRRKPELSQLESKVMDIVWSLENATAEDIRLTLEKEQAIKDSTVRTILRRLEEKGYVEYEVDGRTYVYRPQVQSHHVATDAVRGIIDRFCDGSVENLLVGMVDDKLLTPDKLRELAEKIAEAEAGEKRARRKKS